ncbi:hypothetical protein [Burkholderia gladioli]|uniref:hypothetical protein n=1 Tax=Burkholderia gladioli TaxID=28095 RepID=UPI0016408944|nr:hypothetical protein [Burkholderia gladioli]
MFFTSRELAAVALTGADNYLVDVRQEDGKWVVEVSVLDASKREWRRYFVQTNRGKTKTWRYLEDALAFVGDYCENCQNLTVTVNGKLWRLRASIEQAGDDRGK